MRSVEHKVVGPNGIAPLRSLADAVPITSGPRISDISAKYRLEQRYATRGFVWGGFTCAFAFAFAFVAAPPSFVFVSFAEDEGATFIDVVPPPWAARRCWAVWCISAASLVIAAQ